MEKQKYIGIDLGGTNIKGVLIDSDGNISERMEQPTKDSGEGAGEQWKNTIHEMVHSLRKSSQSSITAVGISAPGMADEKNESIACMPGRLQGLEHFNWPNFLELDDIPVRVVNDAQAALMAESAFGAAKGYKHVVLLTLGTGVGGGILIDGKLYQGHFQRAGHVGHISLDAVGTIGITNIPGSLEESIGNASLPRRSDGRFQSTDELLKAYENGDHHAAYVWLTSVRNLAIGICALINAFAPEVVIIGGGITHAGDNLFTPLEQFKAIYEWQPGGIVTPIKKAIFSDLAGAIGAAGFAYSMQGKT
ncbi:MAG: ROK family protein [Balneolaceae bacterium]|nr:MAG: ROK family protein [Balneolaceae bacterium]